MDRDGDDMDKSRRMSTQPNSAQRKLLADRAEGEHFFLEVGGRRTGPLAVAFGGREWCGPDYEVRRRSFVHCTVEYVAEGEGQAWIGGGPAVALEAGTLFGYGPNMPLVIRTTGRPMVKYFVSIAGAPARAALVKPVNLFGTHVRLAGHVELRDILDLMIREGQEHGPEVGPICLNLFERFQLKLAQARGRRTVTRDRDREVFLRCKAEVDAEPAGFRSLAEMVRATKVGRPALFRLFRRYLGVTPYQYLLRQKMNRAARDLIGSDVLVKEVAQRLGFDDPLHFSRVFKRVHGIAPAHLRESARE